MVAFFGTGGYGRIDPQNPAEGKHGSPYTTKIKPGEGKVPSEDNLTPEQDALIKAINRHNDEYVPAKIRQHNETVEPGMMNSEKAKI